MDETPILEFKGEYRFLSNFISGVIIYDGRRYANLESAYQAAKCTDANDKVQFENIPPASAKALGRQVKVRRDWNKVRVDVMYDLLSLKFKVPSYATLLINTGERHLSEGNRWGDTFWGVDLNHGVGENNLGILLMKIRSELEHYPNQSLHQTDEIDLSVLYPKQHNLTDASKAVLLHHYYT